jgi:Leucine-rich repeat (LRR) protein
MNAVEYVKHANLILELTGEMDTASKDQQQQGESYEERLAQKQQEYDKYYPPTPDDRKEYDDEERLARKEGIYDLSDVDIGHSMQILALTTGDSEGIDPREISGRTMGLSEEGHQEESYEERFARKQQEYDEYYKPTADDRKECDDEERLARKEEIYDLSDDEIGHSIQILALTGDSEGTGSREISGKMTGLSEEGLTPLSSIRGSASSSRGSYEFSSESLETTATTATTAPPVATPQRASPKRRRLQQAMGFSKPGFFRGSRQPVESSGGLSAPGAYAVTGVNAAGSESESDRYDLIHEGDNEETATSAERETELARYEETGDDNSEGGTPDTPACLEFLRLLYRPIEEQKTTCKKALEKRKWLIILGVVILAAVVGCVAAFVAIAQKGTTSAPTETTAPTATPCSLEAIYEDCETTADSMFTADLPNCLLDRYQGLRQNDLFALDLDLIVTEKKSCAPENLALLSLALHSTNNMTTTTLSNRFGLSMLYFATGGSGWHEQGEMLSEKPHWEWLVSDGSSTGFVCFNDEVSGILLRANNLNGVIPSTLVRFLPALRSIDMHDNDLTGTLPSALAGLVQIQLAGNQLTGTFPHVFAESTMLYSLDISYNKIVSRVPLSFAGTQWNALVFDGVDFPPGPFPASLLSLTDLIILSLRDTQQTGTLPSEMGALTNLKVLALGGKNGMNGTLPTELGNLVELDQLLLHSNSFSGTIPSELGRLTTLSELVLYKNKLTGSMPTEIGNLKNLQRLIFDYNNFDGDIPDEVCALNINEFGGTSSSCPVEDFGGLVCPTQECCNC